MNNSFHWELTAVLQGKDDEEEEDVDNHPEFGLSDKGDSSSLYCLIEQERRLKGFQELTLHKK